MFLSCRGEEWFRDSLALHPSSPSRKGTQVLLDCNTNDLIHPLCLPIRAGRKPLRWRREETTFQHISSIAPCCPQGQGKVCIPPPAPVMTWITAGAFSPGHTHCYEACRYVIILGQECPGTHLPCGFPRPSRSHSHAHVGCPTMPVLWRCLSLSLGPRLCLTLLQSPEPENVILQVQARYSRQGHGHAR